MRKLLSLSTALVLALTLGACDEQPTTPDGSAATSGTPAVTPGAEVVDVAAVHDPAAADEHRFEIERRTLPSGWTTFRFSNQAHVPHFFIVQKLPEAREDLTVEEYVDGVSEPFQTFMDLINDPEVAFSEALGTFVSEVDPWYLDPGVTIVGGPGLTSPGRTSRSTLDLEPGRYVVECYVKTDGVFHSSAGMLDKLTVTEEESGARQPRADAAVSIGTAGIDVEAASPPGTEGIRSGEQTVEVRFEDQTTYSHFLGHDLHLVRLEGAVDHGELAAWMDWSATEGLESPAPVGVEFMGGTQDAPAGATTYVTVNLEPGQYAWIAEVPDPADKGMFETFTVPVGQNTGG